ncbi:helix-turn-helix domain-containing protein, partial [Enterococcus casseliflavus]|uniref:helix-turn-helix domain-containing protein n=1 Tax=Enterococcus casseliflavus TaxID=37734 RepID=UPI00325BC336
MLYLLKYRKTRVVDISEKLMFSKSYSYKLISRLRDIFESQRIPITINSDFESISLEGNEKYIRTYHYLVQVMAYNVFADRQTRVNIDLVGENYKSLQTTKVKHEILLSILENAVSRGYLVQDLDKKSLEIFNIMKELYEDISLTKLIPINNMEEKENELAFFYF